MGFKTYREKLKAAVMNSQLSREELAKKTGINRASISSFISGRFNPTREEAEKIATVLNRKVEELF